MKTLLKWALDWRTWLTLIVAGLCLWLSIERGGRIAEATRADQAERDLSSSETNLKAALNDKASAEWALKTYAADSIAAWAAQAEASARMAEQINQLNSRVRAAQQEIARADGSLRLDDPMPDSVRDALACAGGDAAACAATTDSGRVPGGTADTGRAPVAAGRDGLGA